MLSEDARQLLLLRAELSAHGAEKTPLLLNTPALVRPDYHHAMARRHGTRWSNVLSTNNVEKIGPAQLLTLTSQLATREPIIYLHPSSGLFLERFSDEPNGLVHRLVLHSEAESMDRPLTAGLVATNEQIWEQRWSAKLNALPTQFIETQESAARWSRPPLKSLRLVRRQNATTAFLGAVYSKSFNHWGVELRRSGSESKAIDWFRRSIAMNPDNLAARINLEYATRCERGEHARLKLAWVQEEFSEALGKYQNWWEIISQNGPVDEPTFLFQSGRVHLVAHNPLQAANVFARCAELSPAWPSPKLWQAQSYNFARQFNKALELTDQLDANRRVLKGRGLAELVLCRTMALRGTGRTNDAAAYLQQFVSEHGEHVQVLGAAAGLYAANSQFESELKLREMLVQRDANNPEWLSKKGLAEIRLARFEAATATLTKALNLSPNDANLRLLRATAYLRAGQLEASKVDYRELLKNPDRSQSARFGLGSIAWREDDTNAVIYYYQQFLSNSAAISPQFNVATERLRQMSDE